MIPKPVLLVIAASQIPIVLGAIHAPQRWKRVTGWCMAALLSGSVMGLIWLMAHGDFR